MKPKTRSFITNAIVTIIFVVTMASCSFQYPYPKQLTLADEALMQGDYATADSILSCFDLYNHNDHRSSHQAFRQLLTLERCFIVSELQSHHFSLVDSLICYYENAYFSGDNLIKLQLFKACIYKQIGDNTTALNILMEAKSKAENSNNTILKNWIRQTKEAICQGKFDNSKLTRKQKQEMINTIIDFSRIQMEHEMIAQNRKRSDKLSFALLLMPFSFGCCFFILKNKYTAIQPKEKRESFYLFNNQFNESTTYKQIKQHAGSIDFHLTNDDWHHLIQEIDACYNNFTIRLLQKSNLSEHELQICCLIKLGIKSSDIAKMLFSSNASIGMARMRLYKKLTGRKGTAKDFNSFIENF
ncbi:MAG: hypothetical protein J6I52_02295 [Prevotella sp.]|nr:hypothetical protein [Prevotella sp.]